MTGIVLEHACGDGDALARAWEAYEQVVILHQQVEAYPNTGECCLWPVVSAAQRAREAHAKLCTCSDARAAARARTCAVTAYTSARRAAARLCIHCDAARICAGTAVTAIDTELQCFLRAPVAACTGTCCLEVD